LAQRRYNPGDPLEIETGPFRGVFDSPDPKESRPTRLFDALNMMIPDLINGSAIVARHGMVGSTTRLGSVPNSQYTGQGVYLHHRLSHAIDRFCFSGGRFYRWDGGTTYEDLTPDPIATGISIDPVNPVFCASYNNQLIVSDEQNQPWVYDPQLETFTLIQINTIGDAWSTKGGPVVYGGKVFFIVKAIGQLDLETEADDDLDTEADVDLTTELLSGFQNSITWSEELDPLTGYQQDGFDNLWVLTQTSNEVLAALSAEEGALVYFRNTGIGFITGEVNENFRASATKDTISTTVGTDAPAAVISINRRIWFVDLDGRVYRAVVGAGEPQQLWFPARREIEDHVGTSANRDNVAQVARVAYHSGYNLVLFTIWDRQTIYAFDADSGVFVGSWSVLGDLGAGVHIDAMGSLIDANNRATFVVQGTRTSTYDATTQGVLWRQKQTDDVKQWLDQADEGVATYTPLVRAIETHWLASTAAKAYRITEVFAQLLGDVARHAVGLQYVVPSGGASRRLVAQSTAAIGEKSAADTISRAAWSPGPNAQGTSARIRLSATHADNVRWGVHDVTVNAVVTKARRNAA
jgi:hypothetical protein